MTKPKAVHSKEWPGAACAAWALLLPDAADGLLSEAERRALDQHLLQCRACTEELAAAHRGLAWLTVLKDQAPEPPPGLLADILSQTTGVAETGAFLPELHAGFLAKPGAEHALTAVAVSQAGAHVWQWLRGEPGTWSSLLQPRLAMTGGMAFLSICLTMNLLGLSVTQLDAQGFSPAGLHRTVADTSASVIRSIQGIRIVYRVQSRVSEMRAQTNDPLGGNR